MSHRNVLKYPSSQRYGHEYTRRGRHYLSEVLREPARGLYELKPFIDVATIAAVPIIGAVGAYGTYSNYQQHLQDTEKAKNTALDTQYLDLVDKEKIRHETIEYHRQQRERDKLRDEQSSALQRAAQDKLAKGRIYDAREQQSERKLVKMPSLLQPKSTLDELLARRKAEASARITNVVPAPIAPNYRQINEPRSSSSSTSTTTTTTTATTAQGVEEIGSETLYPPPIQKEGFADFSKVVVPLNYENLAHEEEAYLDDFGEEFGRLVNKMGYDKAKNTPTIKKLTTIGHAANQYKSIVDSLRGPKALQRALDGGQYLPKPLWGLLNSTQDEVLQDLYEHEFNE